MASVVVPGLSSDITIVMWGSLGVTIVHVASVGVPGLYLDVAIVHVASIFLGHHYSTYG